MSLILGISAYYHDSAAALVDDGQIVAAAHEERFTRRRHDPSFPGHAVEYCLREAGVELDDLDGVAYYEDPRLKFRRVLATFATVAPAAGRSFHATLPSWLGRNGKLRTTSVIDRELRSLRLGTPPAVVPYRHHESHAASAFFPSPFASAAVLCIDGVGEWATTSLWRGDGTRLEQLAEIRFPHSIGLLYSAFTYFCGFKVDSGEYKLMGLAPYGEPRYVDAIKRELIDIKPDGSFRLNLRYFEYLHGEVMTGAAFERLFGGPRRRPEGPLTQREFDLAASAQAVTEEVVVRLAATAREMSGERALCLAGGVALNCVANGKVSAAGTFDELWVQPAAGDAGGSIGAALLAAMAAGGERKHLRHGVDGMRGSLLGPAFDDDAIERTLTQLGARYRRLPTDALVTTVADELAGGKVVGWFQGRTEFGPRALGARSILGDPRDPDMQSAMNLKIKFRESFRPFAPAVLADRAGDYFDLRQKSPYMLLVAPVAATERIEADTAGLQGIELLQTRRSTIPAVTHVDGSARVQTVDETSNRPFLRLLEEFAEATGCPVLINTSFNVRGEPIVNTPAEAYTCFMRTGIDVLAIGDYLLYKSEQPDFSEEADWRELIPLD